MRQQYIISCIKKNIHQKINTLCVGPVSGPPRMPFLCPLHFILFISISYISLRYIFPNQSLPQYIYFYRLKIEHNCIIMSRQCVARDSPDQYFSLVLLQFPKSMFELCQMYVSTFFFLSSLHYHWD
jgi:hypothetical protein